MYSATRMCPQPPKIPQSKKKVPKSEKAATQTHSASKKLKYGGKFSKIYQQRWQFLFRC